jgi:hypothetical protein
MYDILGCVPQASGWQANWNEMDIVAGNVDKAYCSQNCPCALTNITGFEDVLDISATYINYTIKSAKLSGKIRFQNCSEELKTNVQYVSSNQTVFSNFSNTIKFWRVLEDSFNCTGWCKTTYNNLDFDINKNTCMNQDKITPCNCTDYNGKACSSCVEKSDNRSICTNYIRPTRNIEKYLFSDINK